MFVINFDMVLRLGLTMAIIIVGLVLAVLYDTHKQSIELREQLKYVTARLGDSEGTIRELERYKKSHTTALEDFEERIVSLEEESSNA
jgi:ABC-type multidrug transport system fused ATPase/permease subunit